MENYSQQAGQISICPHHVSSCCSPPFVYPFTFLLHATSLSSPPFPPKPSAFYRSSAAFFPPQAHPVLVWKYCPLVVVKPCFSSASDSVHLVAASEDLQFRQMKQQVAQRQFLHHHHHLEGVKWQQTLTGAKTHSGLMSRNPFQLFLRLEGFVFRRLWLF